MLEQAWDFIAESGGKGIGVLAAFSVAYVAARLVAVGAFEVGFLPVEIAALVLLAVATAVAVWWAFGSGVRSMRKLGRAAPLAVALGSVGFATGTFAAVTTWLWDSGHLDLTGSRLVAIGADEDATGTFIGIAADFYLWHLLDSVPLLDIPATIRWSRPYEYSDNLSGWLLLAFKGFIILPLIQAVRLIFQREEGTEPASSPPPSHPATARPARSRAAAARRARP